MVLKPILGQHLSPLGCTHPLWDSLIKTCPNLISLNLRSGLGRNYICYIDINYTSRVRFLLQERLHYYKSFLLS